MPDQKRALYNHFIKLDRISVLACQVLNKLAINLLGQMNVDSIKPFFQIGQQLIKQWLN